jgi:hypothetical protein
VYSKVFTKVHRQPTSSLRPVVPVRPPRPCAGVVVASALKAVWARRLRGRVRACARVRVFPYHIAWATVRCVQPLPRLRLPPKLVLPITKAAVPAGARLARTHRPHPKP